MNTLPQTTSGPLSRRCTVTSLVIGLTAFLLISLSNWQNRAPEPQTVNKHDLVVAQVNRRSITLSEVEQRVALPLYQVDQQRYQLLQQTIQLLIDDELLKAETSRRGLTLPQLLEEASQSESVARLADFPAPVKRLPVSGQRSSLNAQEQARIRQALIVSLRRKADVRIAIPAFESPVLVVGTSDDDRSLGPDHAPITIVEFSDFQCPYCQQSAKVLKELRQVYGEKVRVVYRDYLGPNHLYAFEAAEAARCAGEQGKFWAYHDLLFERQSIGNGWDFLALAKELGLQQNAFGGCLRSGRFGEPIAKDLDEGLKLGITSTPTFFINGRPLVGAQPLANFRALIDPLLAQLAPQ